MRYDMTDKFNERAYAVTTKRSLAEWQEKRARYTVVQNVKDKEEALEILRMLGLTDK